MASPPSPFSDSPPSGVPPTPSATPPPPLVPITPVTTPTPPSASPPPPSNAPPPGNSGTPAAPPPVPVQSSPPPKTSAPPPDEASPPPVPSASPPVASNPPPVPSTSPPPVSPPVTPQTPPPVAFSAPPPPSSPRLTPPPPQIGPPGSSPPPDSNPPPGPPDNVSPPPAFSPPPPTSTPPRRSPPSPSTVSPPPPNSSPGSPVGFPPPPPSPTTFTPPVTSPTPPATQPPRSSPSRPPVSPQPPSVPNSSPPPSVTPGTSPPAVQIPPSSQPSPPGPSKTVPSSPSVPGNKSDSDPQAGNHSPKSGIDSSAVIAIGIVSVIVLLGLIGLFVFWMFKRKKRSSAANNGHVNPASMGSSPRSGNQLVKAEHPTSNVGGGYGTDTSNDHGGYGHSRSWFTYRELAEATGGFSDENLLGEGGFGCVYKGRLADGRVVAVKQLKIGGGQGEREFKAEVEIISRIHHRHLVSLVGYCVWESKRLLVYDYVPNNTLHFHLHGEGRPVLDWRTRVKIAIGAARGIAYLHEDCHPRVIHRDIKSANILIDNNYDAQVSDFGLAKLVTNAETHISTRVMGTFGYMAPEYATTGKLTDKSDVFSFGVVLLELITGRKPVDTSQSLGDESLVQWARPLLSHALDMGDFDGLVDPRLEKNYIEREMVRMIEAAAACVRHSSSKRPKMGQIVRALGDYESGDLSNGLKVGESQVYNSAQQSADIRWFRRQAFGSPDSSSDAFSQPTQSSSISTYSRPDMYFSGQPVQGGNSRQFSHESQNPLISGQRETNVDIPEENIPDVHFSRQTDQTAYHSTYQGDNSRQLSQESQNPNISGQHEINVNIPEEN